MIDGLPPPTPKQKKVPLLIQVRLEAKREDHLSR